MMRSYWTRPVQDLVGISFPRPPSLPLFPGLGLFSEPIGISLSPFHCPLSLTRLLLIFYTQGAPKRKCNYNNVAYRHLFLYYNVDVHLSFPPPSCSLSLLSPPSLCSSVRSPPLLRSSFVSPFPSPSLFFPSAELPLTVAIELLVLPGGGASAVFVLRLTPPPRRVA